MTRMIPTLAALLLTPNGSAAAQPAGTYRAHGTEPFWSVTITPLHIRYEGLGERAITVATPRPSHGRYMGRIYFARELTVSIRTGPCNDGMSDRTYADAVTVTVRGATLRGCGGAYVEDVVLTNTSWRITAINGRMVSADGLYHLDFTGDRVSGRAGCNSFGGAYRTAGEGLAAGPLLSTRMACPGRMGDEQTVLRILRSPLSARRPNQQTLALHSAAGSLSLRLVPGARPRR